MPTKPTPQTWTLRFKTHKTTLFLHIDKTQTFASIKTELLAALQETQVKPPHNGTLNGVPIPENADDILLARPVDFNDLEAGWESLEDLGDEDIITDEVTPKAKGKGRSSVSNTGGFRECPLGAGLRDGCVVAFRFRSEDDEVDEDGEMDVTGKGKGRCGKWDVVVPSYDDVYGELEEEGEGEDDGAPKRKHLVAKNTED